MEQEKSGEKPKGCTMKGELVRSMCLLAMILQTNNRSLADGSAGNRQR